MKIHCIFVNHLTEAVQRYHKINNKYPNPIVIYRDGVGEGDLKYVYEQEIKNIRVSCRLNRM